MSASPPVGKMRRTLESGPFAIATTWLLLIWSAGASWATSASTDGSQSQGVTGGSKREFLHDWGYVFLGNSAGAGNPDSQQREGVDSIQEVGSAKSSYYWSDMDSNTGEIIRARNPTAKNANRQTLAVEGPADQFLSGLHDPAEDTLFLHQELLPRLHVLVAPKAKTTDTASASEPPPGNNQVLPAFNAKSFLPVEVPHVYETSTPRMRQWLDKNKDVTTAPSLTERGIAVYHRQITISDERKAAVIKLG
ncbi:unnamed protein product, partial [Amoebophrya sp. A120]|eukprot:GSA120T00018377001.1